MYLEAQKKLHRDISYTNILLREPESSNEKREGLMKELGLSEIEELRKQLGCREGLLIDYDYGLPQIPQNLAKEATESQNEELLEIPPKCSGRTVSLFGFDTSSSGA